MDVINSHASTLVLHHYPARAMIDLEKIENVLQLANYLFWKSVITKCLLTECKRKLVARKSKHKFLDLALRGNVSADKKVEHRKTPNVRKMTLVEPDLR